MSFLDSLFGSGGKAKKSSIPDPPQLADLREQLAPYVQGQQYVPVDRRVVDQPESAYSTIEEDPQLRAQQLDALAQEGQIVDAGGLDARARADIEDALDRQRTETRGAQGAILANARARGIYGSDL